MKKDINDPEFHFEGDSIDVNESLDHPRNDQERVLYAKIKKQKQIDDKKIRLVYTALEKGIPLEDDYLYREMLALYPYYQEKLQKTQQKVNKIKRMKEE